MRFTERKQGKDSWQSDRNGRGKVLGYRHKSHVLESLSFGSYVWKFRKEGNKNAWTCSDPAVYQAYTDSELCGFTFTDDAYIALLTL